MSSFLLYRGVAYDAQAHEQPSDRPVVHMYRGQAYSAPLRHPVSESRQKTDLCYRGQRYISHRDQVGRL